MNKQQTSGAASAPQSTLTLRTVWKFLRPADRRRHQNVSHKLSHTELREELAIPKIPFRGFYCSRRLAMDDPITGRSSLARITCPSQVFALLWGIAEEVADEEQRVNGGASH